MTTNRTPAPSNRSLDPLLSSLILTPPKTVTTRTPPRATPRYPTPPHVPPSLQQTPNPSIQKPSPRPRGAHANTPRTLSPARHPALHPPPPPRSLNYSSLLLFHLLPFRLLLSPASRCPLPRSKRTGGTGGGPDPGWDNGGPTVDLFCGRARVRPSNGVVDGVGRRRRRRRRRRRGGFGGHRHRGFLRTQAPFNPLAAWGGSLIGFRLRASCGFSPSGSSRGYEVADLLPGRGMVPSPVRARSRSRGIRMGTSRDRHFFPLTSLQIGDLQSYLSHLTLFLAIESKKFLILVDNRPWLIDQDTRPAAHLWQLMVTKSRMSPFANSRARRESKHSGKRYGFTNCSKSSPKKSKLGRWFSVIDAAVGQKKPLLPVRKLKENFLLNKVHHNLYGFIVFEVSWSDVRGINYLNELQTDTSMALEVKLMKRWEFDSIGHACSCMSSWYTGSSYDYVLLQNYLNELTGKGEAFYDAEEGPLASVGDREIFYDANDVNDEKLLHTEYISYHDPEDAICSPCTPPASGPYKRRKILKSSFENDIYEASEEAYGEPVSSPTFSVVSSSSDENENGSLISDATTYKDVLILFRFDDHDLPFRLKEIIMPDLRLLRLLEYGLPSWVIFLQSYPVFRKFYRPWMCPLARALYVLISVITVLIGFYDLYKNVPVLKATASHLFGPFFDWIETLEMISRIKYLGTMLFIQNFEKAITWFLMFTRAAKSLFSVLTKPIAGPILEVLDFLIPFWNLCIEAAENLGHVICMLVTSSFSIVTEILEILIWPFWLICTTLWSIATYVIYPILWIFCEIILAPARLVLAMTSFIVMLLVNVYYTLRGTWSSISSLFQLASSSQATVSTYELSIWQSLWNDLFSKVFRALKSILYGVVAFFTACNRHRLSIYNHVSRFVLHLSRSSDSSRPSHNDIGRTRERNRSIFAESERDIGKHNMRTPETLEKRRRRKGEIENTMRK